MLPPPVHYHPDLTHDRLVIVAQILLDEFYRTVDDLSSETDDNYTRGCASFGRQKNRIKQLALSGTYPWLQIMNTTNDLVFKIGGVPCRFSCDDPENPRKDAVLTINRYQMSFFDEVDNEQPCRYCFIIDSRLLAELEPNVVFMGFDANGNVKCQWQSGAVRTLHGVGPTVTPPVVEIGKPAVTSKKPFSETQQQSEEK